RDRDRRQVVEARMADLMDAALPSPTAAATAARGAADDLQVPEGATIAEQLHSAKATLRRLLLRLKPDHPDVVHLARIIRELEEKDAVEADARRSDSVPASATSAPEPGRQNRLREVKAELETLDRELAAK